MRVLFLLRQPCIRTLKYAVGLRGALPDLRLDFAYQGMTLGEWYGAGDELFDRWWKLGADPEADLDRVVQELRPDLIHGHNLPDTLTVVAIERYGDRIPVLHDVHDMQSLRKTPYEDGFPEPRDPHELERLAVEGAAALVTVSAELVEELAARYRLPERVLTFPNYSIRRDLPTELPPPERAAQADPRVVYEGSLSTLGGHYDLRDVFAELAGAGVRLDVYPARPAPGYEEFGAEHPGITMHQPLPPAKLLERLPGYDLGWAGFNATLNRAHLDTALPNKAFEYIGCGLPVVTLTHRALAELVRRERIGIVLARPADLPAALAETDLVALRRRVAEARMGLTVEANIGSLVELYRDLVGVGSSGAVSPVRDLRGSPH